MMLSQKKSTITIVIIPIIGRLQSSFHKVKKTPATSDELVTGAPRTLFVKLSEPCFFGQHPSLLRQALGA